jgi:hypothetical protein
MIVIDFWADLRGVACVAARRIGDVGTFEATSLAVGVSGR